MNDLFDIKLYDYELPQNRIAKYPLEKRDQSKLLVFQSGTITDTYFYELDKQLPENSLLIINTTKVVYARLFFTTQTGAHIEVFCLEPMTNDNPSIALHQTGEVVWKCMVGNLKRWKSDETLVYTHSNGMIIEADLIEKLEVGCIIQLRWNDASISFATILDEVGHVPLPPYMKRSSEENDKYTYQTTYAQKPGSVAAPTAGLHMTDFVMQQLKQKGILTKEVSLHVGAGTFKPITSTSINEHEMHKEYFEISIDTLKSILEALENKRPIVPVGTTSVRSIESAYWLACKWHQSPEVLPPSHLYQSDAYTLEALPPIQAISFLISQLEQAQLPQLIATTQLMIRPGYQIQLCSAIITNFHQPKSTLMCLVGTFVGVTDLQTIYQHALANDYRFLSYGDSSLLWKN
jgi:S-adenosylmethionine:tRNA ribosyltransferase-isomerase